MEAYQKINFEDSPSSTTPLNAANLNHMDDGIAAATDGVTALESSKLSAAAGAVDTENLADESITVEKVADDLAAVINAKEVKSNKKTTLTGNESSNDFYPTTKAVADALSTKAPASTAYTFDSTTTNVVYNVANPKTIYTNAYVNGKSAFVLTTANNHYQIALCYDGSEYTRQLTGSGSTTYNPWLEVQNKVIAEEVGDLKSDLTDLDAYEYIQFTENGYISTTGQFVSSAANWCTDFIALSNAIRLKCRVLYISAISSVAFYDKDKIFLSRLEGIENNTYYESFIEAPPDTEFVRFTKWGVADNSVYVRRYSNITPEHEIDTENRIKAIESNPPLTNFYNVPLDIAGFLTKTNATITENANFRASNYINIEHCENITFQSMVFYSFAYLVFYDRGLKPLEIKSPDQSEGRFELTETINHAAFPDNAVYARFSTYIAGDYNRYFAHIVYSTEAINNLIDKQSYLILEANTKKYPHSILKPIIFQGKNAVVFGDSIAYGVYSTENGTVLQKTQSFIDLFASANNITLDNQAVSGTTISNNGNGSSIFNKIINYNNYNNKDIIFIAGGTNDFNRSIEIGELDSTNNAEFFGALTTICEHLKTNASNAIVIFISPIPYTDAYYNKRSSNGTLQYPYKYGNLVGKTLNDYRNAIYEIVTQYGFNIVNGGLLGMPEGNAGGWNAIMCSDADGCHPTIMGHHLYAHNLAGVLL